MPKPHSPYPPEFRRRIVELVRSGRSANSLAQEFEPSAQTIRNWVMQADLDEGVREDGLTTDEREELRRLKRENRRLREEKEIPRKSRGLVCQGDRLDAVAAFGFVKQHQAQFSVRVACRGLGVSANGYYP